MEFKMGDIRFIVKSTFCSQIPMCECKKEKVSAVALPCLHPICSKNFKNKECQKCEEEINTKEKLMDIYTEILT